MVSRTKWLPAALCIASTAMAAASVKQEAGLDAGRRAYEASDYARAIQALQLAAANSLPGPSGKFWLKAGRGEQSSAAVKTKHDLLDIKPLSKFALPGSPWLVCRAGPMADCVPARVLRLGGGGGSRVPTCIRLSLKTWR